MNSSPDYSTIGNPRRLMQRISLVIDILSSSSNDQSTASPLVLPWNQSVPTPTWRPPEEAVALLQSLLQDLSPPRRFLEDGHEYTDDDDYFASVYRSSRNSDVSVTYDEEDNTVVTVGDDVIVLVEHNSWFYVYNIGMVLVCIVVGATMAGLLMGIMSLDPLIVGVKARTAPSERERRQALALLPFVQNKNLVLVSLLLVNCGTNEALPIFLDTLLENPWLTVTLSLTVVLVVGEIVPSAYFTGRDQVRSACELIPILRFVIILTSPISYPLAKLMDHYFHGGAEVSSFKRGEVTAMVRIQYEEHLAWKRRRAEEEHEASLRTDISVSSMKSMAQVHCEQCHSQCNPLETLAMFNQTECYDHCVPQDQCGGSSYMSQTPSVHQELGDDDIIKLEGALTMKDKRIQQLFTPMNRVVSVLGDTILDEDMIVQIYSYGYSRIPVMKYLDESHQTLGVCGILLTKQLMLIGKNDGRRVTSLTLYQPPCLSPDTSLSEALNIILKGKRTSSNMALVCFDPDLASAALLQQLPIPVEAGVVGVVTLENILEELIQEQIYDEKDKKINSLQLERTKWVVYKWKAFVRRRQTEREERDILRSDHPFDFIRMNEFV
jgi:metal transporter CNNM